MAEVILPVVRLAVALCSGVAGVVALTHWLVRRGTITPFGWWPRTLRRLADPVVRPMERQVVRRGGNPQHAPYWVLALVVGAGLVLISFTQWALGFYYASSAAATRGPRGILRMGVDLTFSLLELALLVRVIGSWFGVGRWTTWMRPFHLATDWIVLPLQRVLPTVGPVDVSPMVAWLILTVLHWFIVPVLG